MASMYFTLTFVEGSCFSDHCLERIAGITLSKYSIVLGIISQNRRSVHRHPIETLLIFDTRVSMGCLVNLYLYMYDGFVKHCPDDL